MVTLCHPIDHSPQGSSVHAILQAGILKWVAISSSMGSSRHRDQTWASCSSCIAGEFFTAEPPGKPFTLPTHIYFGIHSQIQENPVQISGTFSWRCSFLFSALSHNLQPLQLHQTPASVSPTQRDFHWWEIHPYDAAFWYMVAMSGLKLKQLSYKTLRSLSHSVL